MPTRIDKLTPEQEARFGEWRQKWIAVGLSTAPADRARFEAAALECYRLSGLPPPKRIVWVPSPLVGAIAAPLAAFCLETRKRPQISAASVDASVDASVRDSVDASVRDSVAASEIGRASCRERV